MMRLDRAFFAIGFVLLGAWGVRTFDSVVYSRAAIARFDVNQVARAGNDNRVPSQRTSTTTTSVASWPISRVLGYRKNLLNEVDTPLAVLSIPRIHLEVPVFNGTDGATLRRGVGRIAGSAQIGEGGNLAIAGHRDGFFRGLKDLSNGDLIKLSRPGRTDFYFVDSIEVVGPQDVSVLHHTPTPSLTLITCFPFVFVGSAPQRFVIKATLQSSSGFNFTGKQN